MKLFPLLLVSLGVLGVSCERHDFEETRKLHEHHSGHAAGGDHGNHADAHAEGEKHGEKSAH
jgi:hypothetical protein